MIPRIIHYCWFGTSELPQECLKTWKTEGYEVKCWNESCSYIQNDPRLQQLVKEEKWCYLSDYIRLLALNEYGGIYMDTDVVMLKPLDELLNKRMFLGFISSKSVGTAIIACEPGHEFIQNAIDVYDTYVLPSYLEGEYRVTIENSPEMINNNDIFTWLLLKRKDFRLNGKTQKLNDMKIYGCKAFEWGGYSKNCYTLHRCNGKRNNRHKSFARHICLPLEMLRLRYVALRLAPVLPFRNY